MLIFLVILIVLKDSTTFGLSIRAYDADDCSEMGTTVQEYLEAHPDTWNSYHIDCEIDPLVGGFIKHSA